MVRACSRAAGCLDRSPHKGRFPLSAFVLLAAAALASAPPADLEAAPAAPAAAPAQPVAPAAPPVVEKPAASPAGQLQPLPGEIVVSGELKAPPGDPLAKANEKSYEVLQAVDDKFVGPVASEYEKAVPRPLRMALRNFIRNLREPVVA
ncbi:MAG: VacJ family lipoprotein, partial [Novosphingobium sp.]|nr:VacJ family lipoprotein [Novosphingobium sp.]